MGGTTFDVSALRDRQLVVTPGGDLRHGDAGHSQGRRALGRRRAAAASPGSMPAGCSGSARTAPAPGPGPACYGRGGTEPTVTDANVVLGIIDPDYFLGGRMKLDRAKAEAAVGTAGGEAPQLGLVGGGLCDLHHHQPQHDRRHRGHHRQRGHRSARELSDLRRRRHRLPYRRDGPHPGHQALHGAEARRRAQRLWRADLRRALGGERRRCIQTSRDFDLARRRPAARRAAQQGRCLPRARRASSRRSARFEFAFQGRYLYQSWDIEVPFELPGDGKFAEGDLAKLLAAFHQHARAHLHHQGRERRGRVHHLEGARHRRHRRCGPPRPCRRPGRRCARAEIPPPGLSRHRLGHDRDPRP